MGMRLDARILKPYRTADLIVRNRAANLLYISLFSSLGFLAGAVFTWVAGDPITPFLALGLVVVFFGIMGILALGRYRLAVNITFGALILALTAISHLNRSGFMEGDLFQSMFFIALALGLLSTFGYTGYLSVAMGIFGLGLVLSLIFIPPSPDLLSKTMEAANREAILPAIVVAYLLIAVTGAFSLFQNGRMLKAMKNALETIESNNTLLEDQVQDRTRALKTILDNTGQGFFTFGPGFSVEPEFSRGCVDIFGKPIGFEDACDLLYPKGGDAAQEFRQGLELYFKGRAKAAVIIDLLEKETYLNGKYLELEYREAGDKKILVILTDVTAQKLLAEKNKAEEERQALVFRALNSKLFFASFLEEAARLFRTLETFFRQEPDREAKEAFLRQLHTFKGNAGFFNFYGTQEVAHDFEYALSDSLILENEVPWQDLFFDLKKAFYLERRMITEAMGQDWLREAGGVVISRSQFDAMVQYLKEEFPEEKRVHHYIQQFGRIPLRDLFARFPYAAQAAAEKLGKKLKPMIFEVDEVRVGPERLGKLAEVCIHIINNMVDHGIEAPYDREARGKDPAGQLELHINLDRGALKLMFRDDGRGIDVEAVAAQAQEKGLIQPDRIYSERDILNLLFAEGFTTRIEVSEMSGRGVGLSAVREEVTRLGGTIDVETRLGLGTSFLLAFPLKRSTGPDN